MITLKKSPDQLWQHILETLKPELRDETFDLWLKPLSLQSVDGAAFVLRVPNRFFSDWIKTNYQTRIEEILSSATNVPVKLQFETHDDENAGPMTRELRTTQTTPVVAPDNAPAKDFTVNSDSKYAFDTFVVGPSNRFAEAAAEAVAKEPGRVYNPLFIYGGVGLGKTHLLHSIVDRITKHSPHLKVLYIPSEHFINEFINAIRFEKMKDFRAKYRSIDCLLIDDIQFLTGKESSQEEFFFTFNSLYDLRKQIVICSDRPPKETNLSDRLVSRFEWGVIADIQPPDLETRIAILRKKSDGAGFQMPDDVMLFVATHIKANIRELEGSITRIMAYASLTGAPLTVDTARHVLKDILTSSDSSALINTDIVQKVVARHFNLELSDMKSKRRTDAIAFPRQLAMYLVRTLTDLSTPEIGQHFGGKDHTTVMHACNKIKNKLNGDPYFVALVNKITQDIREESFLTTPQ